MKKNALFIFLALLSIGSFSQNIADGISKEWKTPLKYQDTQAHLQYDVTNNDSILFVCIRIPDSKFQMKCARAGMSLYIDTTGKKKQLMSLNFPIKSSENTPEKMERPGGRPDNKQLKASILPALKTFNTNGFISGNGTYILKNMEGIIAASSFDSLDILTIEYQIPLKTCYHKLTNSDKGKVITLTLVVKGLPLPQMDGGPDGGGPPMGGGPPVGAGGDAPNFQEMEDLFQSSTTILKYELLLNK
ncbi:MAG: hypothetical protein ACXVPU_03740 [Bacteroidia bacterium]